MTFRYRIFGIVREAGSNRPLPGLLVRAFDKDLLIDDELGSTLTAENGRFEIQFTELKFWEVFGRVFEGRPDLYFRVVDPRTSREIFSTEDRVIREAKGDADVAIEIPSARLG
jgi:hypothetical protein